MSNTVSRTASGSLEGRPPLQLGVTTFDDCTVIFIGRIIIDMPSTIAR
jgi:hypothetical protein